MDENYDKYYQSYFTDETRQKIDESIEAYHVRKEEEYKQRERDKAIATIVKRLTSSWGKSEIRKKSADGKHRHYNVSIKRFITAKTCKQRKLTRMRLFKNEKTLVRLAAKPEDISLLESVFHRLEERKDEF